MMKKLLEFVDAEIKNCVEQCETELKLIKEKRSKYKQQHILNYNYLIGRKLALCEIKNFIGLK